MNDLAAIRKFVDSDGYLFEAVKARRTILALCDEVADLRAALSDALNAIAADALGPVEDTTS